LIAAIAVFTLTPSGAAEQDKTVTPDSPYQGSGSDLRIETRLITVYSLNEILNPLTIDANAENGRVTLTGKVDNQAEKNLAGRIAAGLAGVTGVDNRLEIVNQDTGERKKNRLFRLISDATVATRIEMRLLWNDATSGLDIDVDTREGVATLSGAVSSEEERRVAERIARRTDGVREVKNKLRVAPEETLGYEARRIALTADREISDAWITTRVITSLLFDSAVDDSGINVYTENGVVTLAGTVPNLRQKLDAAEIARHTSGVKKVENKLRVAAWL
jgi:hyperosmotically inducible protein